LRENTYYEPLTMFILSTLRHCAGEQEQKYRKIERKNRHFGCIFHHYGGNLPLSPEILTLHVWWGPRHNYW